jgi:hypothetical protein
MGRPRKEWERKCKRDGTIWFVSLEAHDERTPSKLEQRGTRMVAAGGSMSFASRRKTAGATAQAAMEQKLARIDQRDSCPKCGSGSFTERKVKI